MADTACNFAYSTPYNAKYDITWSFQYSLCGLPGATGGFATFLYDANTPTLQGGGARTGLAFGPYSTQSGVTSAIIGIGFDPTGCFGTRLYGFTTGGSSLITNSYSIRVGTSYTSISYGYVPFDIIKTNGTYQTLRFNLTNLGQTLNVHYKNNDTGKYVQLASAETGLMFLENQMCKIGVSFATPITANDSAIFKIRDLHVHGVIS